MTDRDYRALQELHKEYSSQGLTIMAFPCNQFGRQEPGSNAEIASFAKGRYGVQFPMFAKINVNGANASPVFKQLKRDTGGADIGWNFEKFLVVDGKGIKRFGDDVHPGDIAEAKLNRMPQQ